MSILEELKKKLSDIEIQNLAMEGCSPTFTVSEIIDLIDSVESDKQTEESAQNVPNDDLISRKAAIDALKRSRFLVDAMEKVNKLPPAQPERKKGKWADIVGDPLTLICDQCGYRVKRYNSTNFCPNCGNDKRGG